jgi:hypothetical protein
MEAADLASTFIPKAQLREALSELDLEVTDEESANLFDEFDTDKGDGIELHEFESLLRKPRRPEDWARSLPLAELVADSLPRRQGEDPLRVLSEVTEEELIAMCHATYFGLERIMRQAIVELKAGFRANDSRKQLACGNAGSKFNVVPISCGKILDFHAGLDARIGKDSLLTYAVICSDLTDLRFQ